MGAGVREGRMRERWGEKRVEKDKLEKLRHLDGRGTRNKKRDCGSSRGMLVRLREELPQSRVGTLN